MFDKKGRPKNWKYVKSEADDGIVGMVVYDKNGDKVGEIFAKKKPKKK